MSQRYPEISAALRQFIERQKLFFVATATESGRINVSPKGMDTLRVLGKNRILWLNLTGSGNETAAHIHQNPRMTLMFAGFEDQAMILRVYGHATLFHPDDSTWPELYALFAPIPGARQIFDLDVDLVQASCGMAIPLFDYVREREQLKRWATEKGKDGIREYWKARNEFSLDGKPTFVMGNKP